MLTLDKMMNIRAKMLGVVLWLVSLLVMLMITSETLAQSLKAGFYRQSCPSAERIVRDVVRKAMATDPTIAAGLIRMVFHDCIVRGCDASVLLVSASRNATEQEAPDNIGSLRGFGVIDEAKAKLEAACPKTVSCADILTFAARDGANIAGGISYTVLSGRRDGVISIQEDVHLPGPDDDLNKLRTIFAGRGLSVPEMVALSEAHSFGFSQCHFFSSRLYSFNASHPQDPSLDPAYAKILKAKCPKGSSAGFTNLDPVTPNRLDNQYYRNLKSNKGLFSSDQILQRSPLTAGIVTKYMNNYTLWAADFAAAMIRLNSIGVLTGKQGEICRKCGVKN